MSEEKRILILEPDSTDAEIINMQIRKLGIPLNTRRAGTREMFDRIMAEFAPDIVIADTSTPRCDVLALVRQHRLENPGVRWLIVSGAGSEDVAVESLKAGAGDYVSKKNISRLGAAVQSMLETPPVPLLPQDPDSPPLREESPPPASGPPPRRRRHLQADRREYKRPDRRPRSRREAHLQQPCIRRSSRRARHTGGDELVRGHSSGRPGSGQNRVS